MQSDEPVNRPKDLSYILNHLGEERAGYHGAVAPPIVQSSIFAFANVDQMRRGFADEFGEHMYTRGNNPTVAVLRKKVAALEGAEDCLAFGSGAAAMAAAVFASVKAGDHVICVAKPYSWTRALLRDLLPKFNVLTSFVDGTEVKNFEHAIKPETRLVVLESPNSMTFEQQDLSAVARLARDHGMRTICDNSFASPLNQSPIAHGIDLVVHSATKYLNGHSDVVAGMLCGSEAILREVFKGPYMTFGAILSPHDAWLMIRGLRTLAVRMERIAATTEKVLAFVQAHPKVRRVYHPHAGSCEQPELTSSQLRRTSGLLTIDIETEEVAAVERFCNALKRFLMTVSWGGYESLVFPVCAVFPPDAPLRATGIPLSLVRLSIGLEEADVLIEDIAQALAQV
ncbi:MAG TPA: aminotransferase class I/II-fold pyridoxal phosphate-dependent enzyme [Dokdonella sp.]|uniref:trans-sulfuration enzyme family protein n=1 Tax=Dokdonella sp. TaxID=2291710 RepID=UPI002D80AB63|nr:aminotransferase class I/II-fold pyridoxal phosphate-dependent enzyme [Dokdonella sp.]HET9031725.1 aminotransferase class I/II-fold pyridoxal phosphate-dependent enzyme [Dokdonella sp.]